MENRKLRILWLNKDNLGCGFYRMLLPASKIKDMGLSEVEVNMAWDWEQVKWADIIILQRASDTQAYESIDKAHAMGKKVVYEIDDLLYGINPGSNAWKAWNPIGENLGRALKIMGMCDAVTVTTKRLANEYYMYNKNVKVIPNYLDADLWNQPKNWTPTDWDAYYKKKHDDTIRICWSGASSHRLDLELISDIMTRICKNHPNVQFTLFGFRPQDVFPRIPLRNVPCPHCGAEGQLVLEKGVPLLEYPAKLRSLAADIGIVPVVENSFSEGKSDLKVKEYSACSIPMVASNIKPYSESVKHGVFGYLATTGKEWYDYLEMLINDKKLREQMGKAARRWYQDNTIDKHIHEWLNVYNELVFTRYEW